MDKLFKFTHNLPKIELHAHIGGCFRPMTFLELAEAKNIDTDHIDFYNVDIKTAFEIFKVGSKLITDCSTLKKVVKEIIEDYNKQNCRYLELRSTPKIIGEITSKEMYIDTVIEAINEMKEEIKTICVKFLISVNRTADSQTAKEAVDLIQKYKDPVVGLELSGDPRSGDFNNFAEEFKRAQDLGFKVALHCAETADQKDSQQMIDFKPDRLGHCCFLNAEQIKQVVDLAIPVEICPTSNVAATQCGIPAFLPHLKHFKNYPDANLVICCDDTFLFNTNLSMELFEFSKAMSLTSDQIKDLLVRNIEAIFYLDNDFKETLKSEIMNRY